MKSEKPVYFFITLLIFFFGLMLMASCSSEKKLSKAINNHGQKESAAYFVKHYPEYFKSDTVIIFDTITVIVPEHTIDTTFIELRDTIIIENEKIKVVLKKTEDGWSLSGTVKENIIEVPTETICPPVICPDITILPAPNKWNWFLRGICVGMILCAFFIFLFAKKE
jgi:hypothetical protein